MPESRTQLGIPCPAAIRDELQRAVLLDLLGPAGGPQEEVDDRSLRDRYLVGMLAPRNSEVQASDDDDHAEGGAGAPEDGPTDVDTPVTQSYAPSSIGLTFAVAPETAELRVTCRWGRYERAPSETASTDKGAPKHVWKRAPVEVVETLEVRKRKIGLEIDPEERGVRLEGIVRQIDQNWVISIFLVNSQPARRRSKDSAWLFQAEIVAESPDGAPIFVSRLRPEQLAHGKPDERAEELALAMLYRSHSEYAVGHGVSVEVTPDPDHAGRALRVGTQVVPSYDLPQTVAPTAAEIPALADLTLDMKVLAELPLEALQATLRELPRAYATWIEQRRSEMADPGRGLTAFGSVPLEVLDRCSAACTRIGAGVELLGRDGNATSAFQFMNRAMWQQRVHTLLADAVRRGEKPSLESLDVPENRSWRPFQLAFILLNLPGLTDLGHSERTGGAEATADLLWFPTGGGKTEAYLGLTAYTLAMRRLQGTVAGYDGEHGVAVLMRYTLRLLTLQQFQRAATLICACEHLRRAALDRGDGRWGTVPFRIGLWVGQRTTPNTTDQSNEAIKQSHGQFGGGGSGSPAQLTYCPWCGSPIDQGKDIDVETLKAGRGRTLIYCGQVMGECLFSRYQAKGEGLPVLLVDEEIYRLLPALLIATVDKFAQMPWRGATQMLFGRVTGMCPRHGFRSPDLPDSDSHPKYNQLSAVRTIPHPQLRPPDLIIQDELHLINGPLGALVGLYETAVDQLSTWSVDGRIVRPKVIASTATIRRAGEQMGSLFLRRVQVFPPQGLDASDNFFSRQVQPDDTRPGRRYLGICAPGRRLKAALIRVYVAYLAAAQQLYVKYDVATDPWMTLVGYFNSMRELGGMRRLVEDDVRSRLQRMDLHGLAKRGTPRLEELTSRKSAADIPRLLDRLEVRFGSAKDGSAGGKASALGSKSATQSPLDVLLATNMVSVGVDVKRLGLMVVAGQPKSTAEYIQATSRVGRSFPGLVCTVFNWARPRDLSHYEHFEHFHATFYRHVEALSVTPFAARALDRGLASVLVALVRLSLPDFAANDGAAAFTGEHVLFERAIAAVGARAEAVDGGLARARVEHDLRDLVRTWIARAADTTGGKRLGYRPKQDGVTVGLLSQPELGSWPPFTCLNSVRDVEPEVGLILREGNLDETRAWSLVDEREPDVGEEAAE